MWLVFSSALLRVAVLDRRVGVCLVQQQVLRSCGGSRGGRRAWPRTGVAKQRGCHVWREMSNASGGIAKILGQLGLPKQLSLDS